MSIIRFPRAFKHPLPADAIANGKKRRAIVFPFQGRWAYVEYDDDGGCYEARLSKDSAVRRALRTVMEFRGEMTVLNRDAELLDQQGNLAVYTCPGDLHA